MWQKVLLRDACFPAHESAIGIVWAYLEQGGYSTCTLHQAHPLQIPPIARTQTSDNPSHTGSDSADSDILDLENAHDSDAYLYDQELDFTDPDITMNTKNETETNQDPPGMYTEVYEGCSEAFPGRKSFLDDFRQDEHATEQQANLRCSSPIMQWSADPTEHAHVQ